MKQRKVIIVGITAILFISFLSILYISQISHNSDWKKRTTPLPQSTIDLLCHNFSLSPDNFLCDGKHDVYALDFVKVIRDTFQPYETYGIESSQAATYYDVEEIIGMFKYECESVTHQADGSSYFVCYYDLRGDRKFIVAIAYAYPEMAVMRVNSTSRFYDY